MKTISPSSSPTPHQLQLPFLTPYAPTDITFILDRSSSMRRLRHEVIDSFNNFLVEQKSVEGGATLTLIQFDTLFEVNYEAQNIQEVHDLDKGSYSPRGMTALLDAIGTAINSTKIRFTDMKEEDRPSKVIIIIQTDGEENASKEYTLDAVKKMINEQQDKYSWEFVFLGSNIDAVKTGAWMGIKNGNSMSYADSEYGTKEAFKAISSNLARFRRGIKKDMSYEDNDKKKQEKQE